jgi:hypothetical protein
MITNSSHIKSQSQVGYQAFRRHKKYPHTPSNRHASHFLCMWLQATGPPIGRSAQPEPYTDRVLDVGFVCGVCVACRFGCFGFACVDSLVVWGCGVVDLVDSFSWFRCCVLVVSMGVFVCAKYTSSWWGISPLGWFREGGSHGAGIKI